MERPDQDGFHSRADAVFGKLSDPSTAAPTWSLTKQLVFRAGRAEAYSSEEEQEAEANEHARQEVAGEGLVSFGDGELQDIVKPSEAFCGAIDREDEFDAQDAVALAAGEAAVPQHLQDGDDIAGQALDPPETALDQPGLSKRQRLNSAPGTKGLSTGPLLDQRRARTASRVPDHVRNPSSYTCYTLDEPVWVGGIAGDLKQQDPWQAAQQSSVDTDKAMPDALPALDPPEPTGNALPVQQPVFQPRQRKQGCTATPASSASIRSSGPLALASDLADDAEDRDMDMDQAPPAAALPAKRPLRSIRRKPLEDG